MALNKERMDLSEDRSLDVAGKVWPRESDRVTSAPDAIDLIPKEEVLPPETPAAEETAEAEEVLEAEETAVVEEALREIDPDEAQRKMRSVLEAKYRTLAGDPQEKFKLLKFGLTRGYEYDAIAPVVDDILKKNS